MSSAPAARAVSDITMLWNEEGWLYLAVVLDLATRAVVGWAMAAHMRASLVQDALHMAWTHHGIVAGAIVHSDHGSQYTSTTVRAWCVRHQVRQSMGQTGVCWDNAVAEAYFATLKGDLRGHRFASRQEARGWVVRHIEGWYNRVRPHTYTHGVPPLTAWTRHTSRPYGVSLS
jgi:putative transposase